MAFGISRFELQEWKKKVLRGEIAFLTHYWKDERFPEAKTVTKVGCGDLLRLMEWGSQYGLKKQWIHQRDHYPHFDLIGVRQKEILTLEGQWDHIKRFQIK